MNKLQAIRTRSQEGDKFIIVRSGQQPVSYVDVSRDEVDLLLAVAEAAAAYLVADKAWKDVRDDDDMDEDEVNDLWRAETDAYIALEAAVAPLLIEVTE